MSLLADLAVSSTARSLAFDGAPYLSSRGVQVATDNRQTSILCRQIVGIRTHAILLPLQALIVWQGLLIARDIRLEAVATATVVGQGVLYSSLSKGADVIDEDHPQDRSC